MKVIIAIDSFKGSISSIEAGNCAKEGVERVYKNANTIVLPIADGGEGTVDALVNGLNGKTQKVKVKNPLGKEIVAEYGIANDTAIIEMATASGITLLKKEELNPKVTTTYGVGEMINDAIEKGFRNFIIGIGGSATNDGGVGMLQALGFEFKDSLGNEIGYGAESLKDLDKIIIKNANPKLKDCVFNVACDVTNPLCGESGCSFVFSPQKGSKKEDIPLMDNWLKNYAEKTASIVGKDYSFEKGAGAAGGLGFAFMAYLNAKLKSGIELVLNEIALESHVKDCDIVITGEGKIDSQTIMGKAPIGVAKIAKKYNKPVFAFCGCLDDSYKVCNDYGLDAIFSIVRGAISLEKAMEKETAKKNLTNTVEQVLRAYKTAKN